MPAKNPKETKVSKTSSTNNETTYATTSSLSKEPRQFTLEVAATTIAESFKQHLVDNKKAKATINSYIFDIKDFVEFIETVEKQAFIGIFTESHYHNYLQFQTKSNFKPATINKRINSISRFNNFLLQQKLMTQQIADLKTDKVPLT